MSETDMTKRIRGGFHRAGVAVAVLIALAGGTWTILAALLGGGSIDPASLGIGVVATVMLALAAWGFYWVLGWVVAGCARLLRHHHAAGRARRPLE